MACIVWRDVGLNGMSSLWGNINVTACVLIVDLGQCTLLFLHAEFPLLQQNTNCTPDTKLTMLGQVDSQCCLMCGHTHIVRTIMLQYFTFENFASAYSITNNRWQKSNKCIDLWEWLLEGVVVISEHIIDQ